MEKKHPRTKRRKKPKSLVLGVTRDLHPTENLKLTETRSTDGYMDRKRFLKTLSMMAPYTKPRVAGSHQT